MSIFKELMDITVQEAMDDTNRKFSIFDMFLQCGLNVTENGVPKTIYNMIMSNCIIVDEAIIEVLDFDRSELIEYLKSLDWDKSESYAECFKEMETVLMLTEDFEILLASLPSSQSEYFRKTVNEITNVIAGYEEYEEHWKLHNKNRESVLTAMPYNFGKIYVLGLYKFNEAIKTNRWRLLSETLDRWEEAERLMFEENFNLELVHKWVNVTHAYNLDLAMRIVDQKILMLDGDLLHAGGSEIFTDEMIVSLVDRLIVVDDEAHKIMAATAEYDCL